MLRCECIDLPHGQARAARGVLIQRKAGGGRPVRPERGFAQRRKEIEGCRSVGCQIARTWMPPIERAFAPFPVGEIEEISLLFPVLFRRELIQA